MAHTSETFERPWRGGFWSLFAAQFQVSFSDNALKWLLISFILATTAAASRDNLVWWASTLFSLPFILFSMAGGYFADRFSKRSVVIGTRVAEILVMIFAFVGLLKGSLPMLLIAVFINSTLSAVLSPSKYGLLPELLPDRLLSWGNGVLELGVFLAIILGTAAGGSMLSVFRDHLSNAGVLFIALAATGLLISFGISRVPPADSGKRFRWNFAADLWEQMVVIRADRPLLLAVIGNTYFFFLAALLQLNIAVYGVDVLHLAETHASYMQAAVAIGIGLGSFAAGYLSGGRIEYGLIPIGAIGMTILGLLLSMGGLSAGVFALLLGIIGFFGGFFIVPINALIQHRPNPDQKGAIIGAANLLSFVGIFLAGSVNYALTAWLHLTAPQVFLTSAALTLVSTIYALFLLPEALMRLVVLFLVHSIYRVRVEGRENIPARGGALFVSNHLSLIDALLLMASTGRRVRFLIFKDIYERPLIKPFAKLLGTIPISPALYPKEMLRSLRTATEWIEAGHVVCIFAEGQMTRTGQLLPFRRGLEKIMKGVEAPIVPVHLDGVWGSIFSFERGRYIWKLPYRIPYPVTVTYGNPMAGSSTASEIRDVVQELGSQAFLLRKSATPSLARAFVHIARRRAFRIAMADVSTKSPLRFAGVLTRSMFLAGRLKQEWRGQRMVGILLPPSVPAALVNCAAMLSGKVPVNLNYTLSVEAIASCIRQCEIQTVIASKAFLEKLDKAGLEAALGRVIYLEDVSRSPSFGERAKALALAFLAPAGRISRMLDADRESTMDDLATVIFSSGSTGDPKGVMLTHWNVASNVEQLGQVFALNGDDKLLGILPFFHSFGFTATFVLPMLLGIGVVYHFHPLDAHVIGALVQKHALTFLLATPTFLQAYTRRCEPEQFGSVRLVMVGAEKLPASTAIAFEDRFGIRPLEAYGATECSPAVTVSTSDYRAAGYRQVGAKRGKIGHPLPGVSVRIVDPQTMAPLPPGQPGLLVVRGPNVMKGYLNQPAKTAEVLRDGWYVTGDVAAVDEDGFLEITDRLTRFSKIGGEMVPHIKVEEKLHELAGAAEQMFVVTGVPDEKRGERLVVLHTVPQDKLKDCIAKLPDSGLPNLWLPRPDAFFRIDTLPYLGTGKLDLQRVRTLAKEFEGGVRSASARS